MNNNALSYVTGKAHLFLFGLVANDEDLGGMPEVFKQVRLLTDDSDFLPDEHRDIFVYNNS